MNRTPGNGHAHSGSILLVDDDSETRSLRSIMLGTHGYEVDSVSNSADAHVTWKATRPDLVLLALRRYSAGTVEFLQEITRVSPQQRVAFVNDDSLHLSPLSYNGELVRHAEGPEDLIDRVGALLAVL